MSTRNYDREFKLNAVKVYRESQKPMSQISKDLEIPISTFSEWVKEFESHGEESFPGSGKLKPCNKEVYLLKTQRDKIEFMIKNKDTFPLEKMAQVLDVARSSYYSPQKPSKRCLQNQMILEKAREVYQKSRGTDGSPRIHASLNRLGIQYSRPRVARLMKKATLQAKMVKAWKKTTKKNEEHIAEPNHLSQ